MGFVVQDIHMNPAGICHGGMMMTLMDMAVGMNVQLAAETDAFSPTIQMSYDFLKPAFKDQWLVSEIDFRHTTRRLGFASGLMIGPDGPRALRRSLSRKRRNIDSVIFIVRHLC
jgi:uncharacterized protein (TIGR00369 family)